MWGPITRGLVLSGKCTLCTDYRSGTALDFSLLQRHGAITDPVRLNPLSGASFAGAGVITHPDHVSGRNQIGAIVILARGMTYAPTAGATIRLFSARDGGGTRIDLYLDTTQGRMYLYNGTVASNYIYTGVHQCIGINYSNGLAPNVYIDGSFSADMGAIAITNNDAPILIGNLSTSPARSPIACVLETNVPLTATEHAQVYAEMESARWPTQPWTRGELDA